MTNLKTLLTGSSLLVPKWVVLLFLIGGFVGFVDSAYLSVLHYKNIIPPCSIGECEIVLTSPYAVIFGVPNALLGAFYYLAVIILSVLYLDTKQAKYFLAAMGAVAVGFVFTLWFLYLQAFVIKAFCEYCLLSAGVTITLFTVALILVANERGK